MMEDRWFSADEIVGHPGIKWGTVCKRISERQKPTRRMDRLWKCPEGEAGKYVKTGGADNTELGLTGLKEDR